MSARGRIGALALGLAACGGAQARHDGGRSEPLTPAGGHGVTTAEANRAIHAYAWMDMPFSLSDGEPAPGEPMIEMKDGDGEYVVDAEYSINGWVHYDPPVYGDLDGDGVDEAIIVMTENGGGTGRFDSANVFTLKAGKPVRIGAIPGGDRADGGLSNVAIEGRVVRVNRMLSENSGACCPDHEQIELWAWDGHDMRENEPAREYHAVDEDGE